MSDEVTEIQREFELFREQAIYCRIQYNNYCALFEAGPVVEKLLEKVAYCFFRDLNVMMREHVLLQISKITDPAKQVGRANLTVSYFDNYLEMRDITNEQTRSSSGAMHHYRSHIIDARNKILSHSDLQTAKSGIALGGHTSEDVTNFFKNLQIYCDEVARVLGLSPCEFSHVPGEGDVIDFIDFLDRKH